jgi:hypothetical protein
VEEEKIFIATLQQPKQPAIARQWLCKHVSSATDIHTQQWMNSSKRCFLWIPPQSCLTGTETGNRISRLRLHEAYLTLNGRNIPFVIHVKYLDVIFDKRITWRLHIEMIEAKAFRTFIRIYSLLKSERLSANIKLTLRKSLIRLIMAYACPAWELAADTYLLKLQRLRNMVLRTIGNFPRFIPVRDLNTSFNLTYVYDYIKNCAGNK